MKTYGWDVRNYVDDLSTYPHVDEIITGIKYDELIAIPTETVYGLAANAYSDEAVSKIFKAKGRPQDNPLIIHVSNKKQIERFANIPSEAVDKLMNHFWPGPISFILPMKKGFLSTYASGGLDTIAVRMPDDQVALKLIELSDTPLAAPSANISGKPSPTKPEHVIHDFDGKIYGIIQSEHVNVGIESTVLDCTAYPFKIARPGLITAMDLNEVIPDCTSDEIVTGDKAIAPGMKYRHYAPDSPLLLIDPFEHLNLEPTEAVIAPRSEAHKVSGGTFIPLSKDYDDVTGAMHHLYDALRKVDAMKNIKKIYIVHYNEIEKSDALMNRINKAVSGK